MKATELTLGPALSESNVDYYNIPQYQRPYTWDKDNFEALWKDLTEAFENYLNAIEKDEKPEIYFLGPVVFVKNEINNWYDIIDGQQRITTFHIIFWCLFHKIEDETERDRLHNILTFLGKGKEVKLKVSKADVSTFNHIKDNAVIDTKSKMKDCAGFFRKQVDELSDTENFSKFLREYTQFIVITAEDYGKAWDLFIGLNGKGEPLNPTDLVKAHVCGCSDIGNDVAIIWEEGVKPLNKDSTAYLLFLTRFKSQKFISENNLFKEFSKMFPKEITAGDIDIYSNVFQCFWNTSIDKIPEKAGGHKLSIQAEKSLRLLRDMKRKDFTTLLFQYVKAFGIKSIFDENFLKLLASYQIRMAINKGRAKERKFVEWFKDVEFISEKQALSKITVILKADSPNDDDFERMVKFSDYKNTAVRIILQHKEEGNVGNIKISGFDLEHLMPQKGTKEWHEMAGVMDNGEANEKRYESIVNNIGNLFLLDKKTNPKVGNKPFSYKKDIFQEKLTNQWSIVKTTADKTEWKPSDIEERASEIAKWAAIYWKL